MVQRIGILSRKSERQGMRGQKNYYKDWRNMGQFLHDWYGKKLYTIGFVAYEGQSGIFAPRYSIPTPKQGSLEDVFRRYGPPLLFVNLRRANPFDKPLYGSPMSYNRAMRARWPQIVDGVFYTQEMRPTRRLGTR